MSQQWNAGDENSSHNLTNSGEHELPAEESGAGGSVKKLSLSRGTLAVVGVFAAAVLLLWVLGKQAGPKSADAEATGDDKVDSALHELLEKSGKGENLRVMFKDTDSIVKMFHQPGSVSVPLEKLPINPFDHVVEKAEATDAPPVVVHADDAAQLEKMRRVADEFKDFKLQTVMLGRRATAIINNQFVQVGGHIGNFTVTDIQAQRVILSCAGKNFELRLARPNAN